MYILIINHYFIEDFTMFSLFNKDKTLKCVIGSQQSRIKKINRMDMTYDLHSSYQFSEENEKAIEH